MGRTWTDSSAEVATVGDEDEGPVQYDAQEFKLRATFHHLCRYLNAAVSGAAVVLG